MESNLIIEIITTKNTKIELDLSEYVIQETFYGLAISGEFYNVNEIPQDIAIIKAYIFDKNIINQYRTVKMFQTNTSFEIIGVY